VRMVTLTWNYPNKYGGSCVSGGGLTDEGRAFVRRSGELGVIIDVSHSSDELFWDVAEIAQKPFVASHSNSRSVHEHRRNLTDDQFKAIIKAQGVAGINLYSDFVASGGPTVADVVRHIDHFAELGGVENMAIGADFDGCDRLPEGITGAEDVYVLADELIKQGYSDREVYDIFYNNLRRVIEEVIG